MRTQTAFRNDPKPGPRVKLRGGNAAEHDEDEARAVFARLSCFPPVWIPPERVELIVDVSSDIGMSCVWWLANYWRAQVIALEPSPTLATQLSANVALNGFESRITIVESAAGAAQGALAVCREMGGRRIDILCVNLGTGTTDFLENPLFASFNIGAVTLAWHATQGRGGRDWSMKQLKSAGFDVHVTVEGPTGRMWGFRTPLQNPRTDTPS